MSGMGFKYQQWTKELDDKLLNGIIDGKGILGLSSYMKMSQQHIYDRLKQKGFRGLTDARKVLGSRQKHML